MSVGHESSDFDEEDIADLLVDDDDDDDGFAKKPLKTSPSKNKQEANVPSFGTPSTLKDSLGNKTGSTSKDESHDSFDDDIDSTLPSFLADAKSIATPKKEVHGTKSDDQSTTDDDIKSGSRNTPGSSKKRSGSSFFDDFLKNLSPKNSPKKTAQAGVLKEVDDEEKDTFGKEKLEDFSKVPETKGDNRLKQKQKSLIKQVSFKDLNELSALDDSPEEDKSAVSTNKTEKTLFSANKTEKTLFSATPDQTEPKTVAIPQKVSDKMNSKKEDTDWLNFFKESPKKTATPKHFESKSSAAQSGNVDVNDFNPKTRRKSSNAEWLGLGNDGSPFKSTSAPNSASVQSGDWLDSSSSTAKHQSQSAKEGRRRRVDDSSWLDNFGGAFENKRRESGAEETFENENVANVSNFGQISRSPLSDGELVDSQVKRSNALKSQNIPNMPSTKVPIRKQSNGFESENSNVAAATSNVVSSHAFDAQAFFASHNAERDQTITAIKSMYENRIETADKLHKEHVESSESRLKLLESKLRTEREEIERNFEEKLKASENERSLTEKNFKNKFETLKEEHEKEIKRLKELHNQSITSMKQDHEDALNRLQRLKEQEVEAVLSTQMHFKSLQKLNDELEARAQELASLQVKVDERNQITLREKQAMLESKGRDLKALEARLQKQLADGDDERMRLQQLVLRLEGRLQKYTTEGEEDRWDVQQLKAKLAVQQKHLDEEIKLNMLQVEKEKEKIKLSQDAMFNEQKQVLLQLANERQQSSRDKAELELLSKRVREEESQFSMKKLKEETMLERQKQFLEQERGRLEIEKKNIRQEIEMVDRERENVYTEKEQLNSEKARVQELEYKIKRKASDLDYKATFTEEEKERAKLEFSAARKIQGEHQSRIQEITQKMQNLLEKEHQMLIEKENMAQEKLDLEAKKSTLTCNKCKLLLEAPMRAPPVPVSNTNFIEVPNHAFLSTVPQTQAAAVTYAAPVTTFPILNGHPSATNAHQMDPSLLIWYITAQQDRAFLQEEMAYLKSLKD